MQVVWFGSYNVMKTAIINNQLDGFASITTSANMREIEASPRGLTYPPFLASNTEGWERIRRVADFFEPYSGRRRRYLAPGQARRPHRLPLSDDRHLCEHQRRRGLRAGQGGRRGDGPDPRHHHQRRQLGAQISGKPPADAPWHEGAIRYLKEKDIWTAEHQGWQDRRLARLRRIQAGWEDARKSFSGNGDEAWLKHWEKYRVERLGLSPAEA